MTETATGPIRRERTADSLDSEVETAKTGQKRMDDLALLGASRERRDELELAHRALAEAARQKDALYQLTDRLQRAHTLDDIYDAALHAIVTALPFDRASILLFDDAGVMRFVASRGLSHTYRSAVEGHSPWSAAEKDPAPVCIGDIETAELSEALKAAIRNEGIGAAAFIPLVVDGKLIGKFMTYFNGAHGFGDDEVAFSLTIARQLAFAIDRRRADDALREREAQLRVELADTKLLQAISADITHEEDIDVLYQKLVEAAVAIMRSDFASMQMFYLERGSGGELRLLAFRGFNPEAAKFWEWVRADSGCTCGEALRTGKRVIAPDVEKHAYLSGTEDLNTLRQTGIRAVQTTPLYSRGGKLVGMISTHWRIPHEPSERDLCLLDILARQAADLIERKRAEEALRESDRRKDEFLATLSHELRNPLAPIRQAAKLLKAPDISERDAQWARDVIDRQVRAMGWLLDDLLDLSRIARGKLELRKESVELADIVESAVETARPLIDAKRHALRIELPATAVRFEADPLRLAQIVSNLLTNAAKYTEPQGQIRLWAREEQDELIIGVTDTGIGISADMLPKVFEMFSQAAPALDRTEGGLGIGLALVRGFAALHRGSVAARSDGLGRGSEFTLRLPLGTPSVQSAAAVPTAAHSHRAPGRRVLVVDDNRDTAETLATLLHMQGYEVRTAFDGREALDVAEAFHPDITLLDIGMPQMNGYEAAQHIRSRLWGQRTTLIAVTGWGQEDDMRRAIASGFDYHLRKPIDFDLLQPLLTVPPAGR